MNEIVYNKANSIQEIRGIENKKEIIISHLKKYKNEMDTFSYDDPFRKAINDIFDIKENLLLKEKFILRDHVVEEMARLDPSYYKRYLRYRYVYEIY